MTALRPGARLKSQVDGIEVIVVRPPDGDVELTCGGQPMVDVKAEVAPGLTADPALRGGTPMGKRFTLPDGTMEILVTKAGEGTLADGATPLVLKEAKPLPSSD